MEKIKNSFYQRNAEPESGVLYVVGTPIGNLYDFSERNINLLKKVSIIACEDTRVTKKLLNAIGINNKLISFNEYNSKVKTDFLLKKLKDGSSIALVSDAGLPVISDPGEHLVKKAREISLEVICSPGPCAALTGLVSSGLPSSNFLFIGFLNKKKIEREKQLKLIANNFCSTIVYESPKRVVSFIKELNNYCEETRTIHLCKELTKKYEWHWQGSLKNLIPELKNVDPRGEFTIIIAPKDKNQANNIDEQAIKKDLEQLIQLGLKRSSASSYLAYKNKIPKNIIYNLNKETPKNK